MTTPANGEVRQEARLPDQSRVLRVVLAVSLCAAVGTILWIVSGQLGFIQIAWDDSFITYIYARNLAAGEGLRYNAADAAPTEGFSSLLHVLLLAVAYRLNLDPLVASRALNLLGFVLTPLAIGLPLARLVEASRVAVLGLAYCAQLAMLLLPATFLHLEFGMETLIFMAAVAALAGWSLAELTPPTANPSRGGFRAAVGITAAMLVVLGRPEGLVLVVLTLVLVFGARWLCFRDTPAPSPRPLLMMAAVTTALLAAYFIWKLIYFGYLLANPYYVKGHNAILGKAGVWLPGLNDTILFLIEIVLPWLGACAVLLCSPLTRGRRLHLILAVLPGLGVIGLYAGAIHEAAWGWRYEFPFISHLLLVLVGLLALHVKRFPLLSPLLVAAAVITVWQVPVLKNMPRPVWGHWLSERVDQLKNPWAAVGKDLGASGLGKSATIATAAAGMVPYFSEFRTLDLFGLNDNYLCGRKPHSIPEVWEYIDSLKPDVYFSGLPPATLGKGINEYDPALRSLPIRMELFNKGGSELSKFWDSNKRYAMIRREMVYLRDNYTFGAAYDFMEGSRFMILYVRRDSPHRDRLLKVLRASVHQDITTDLQPFFITDPRRL